MKSELNDWPVHKPTKYDLLQVEIDYAFGLGFPDGYSEIYTEKIDSVWVNVVSYPETFLPSREKGVRILVFIGGRKCEKEIINFTFEKTPTPFEIISSIIWG